ncbi:MAG: ElyC/SanA/YdcF family protein [Desulfobaccales bacterium]
MFLFKKIVTPFLYPLPLCLWILLLGLVILWGTRRQRLGKAVVTLGTVLLFLLSSNFFSTRLTQPLEQRYPPLQQTKAIPQEGSGSDASPTWIVVLGGGAISAPSLPANSQLSRVSLSRLVEGVRIYKTLPGSRLLLSGGPVFNPIPEAKIMGQVAGFLGVNAADIVMEQNSRDTADQAEMIARIVGKNTVILVTSAAHLPRAMRLFENQGLHPIPAPTAYESLKPAGLYPAMFFPNPRALSRAGSAIHEYLGLTWIWLRRTLPGGG